ncbi:FAD:protein FMN transferase [Paenibacillus albiflavus]|uniref:FAD:protein FMN transferase n=1 Tax=Paenibacillus albiflavus TaxID=2545760 RepID=A0A4V2WNX4_9BACL|nr:FAD:protein FMN transferase [Paenibacillus albiflavus]TCZ77092.1 FAD:protein FMN transferase [Paenibacillus albiflavus]
MEKTFRAMNTEVTVIIDDVPEQLDWADQVQQLFQVMEATASRFSVDSELSRLNNAPIGNPYMLTEQLYDLFAYAWKCTLQSDFKFNPLIGSVLNRIGYDRSFEKIERVDSVLDSTYHYGNAQLSERFDFDVLSFSDDLRSVTKHKQVNVDLGGIGKGWTVDLAYRLLQDDLQVQQGAIDAGGDMRVWSNAIPWQVGIQHPTDEDQEVIQLWIKEGAIATSNVMHRRWIHHGNLYHHIIDGQTMQVANSDIVQATVLAPSTAQAEVVSKVICMLEASEVNNWVSSHFEGVGYIFITKSGEIKLNRDVKNYVEELNW